MCAVTCCDRFTFRFLFCFCISELCSLVTTLRVHPAVTRLTVYRRLYIQLCLLQLWIKLAGWLAGWLRAARPAGWLAGLIEFYTCSWYSVFFEEKQWLRMCQINWYLYFAHGFGKMRRFTKTTTCGPMAQKYCVFFKEKWWFRMRHVCQHFCLHTCSRNTLILLKKEISWTTSSIGISGLSKSMYSSNTYAKCWWYGC